MWVVGIPHVGSGNTASTCAVTYTQAVAGSPTITAQYAGDANFAGKSDNASPSPTFVDPTATPTATNTATATATATITNTPTNTPTSTSTSTAVLSASPGTVATGGAETVSWSGIPGPTGKDWIGLYAVGAADANYADYRYISCTYSPASSGKASGSCGFTMPTSAGSYEFRFFSNDTLTRLATSNQVTAQ
jgi:hypothetical protein